MLFFVIFCYFLLFFVIFCYFLLFNSEERDSFSSNMQGALIFEKTPHSLKWREIGYVSFPECHRFFGVRFIGSGDDELGYNLMVSSGSKSGKDLVYLPDELAAKYYSRLSQTGVMLGLSDITIRQMSGFLAYNRMRFQELRDGTHKTKIGKKQIPRRGKPFSQYGQISV